MELPNSTFGLLAAHVNDLRRMWFVEHEKNRKLKEKLNRLKDILQNVQIRISQSESELNLNSQLDFSYQSTLEHTVNFRYSDRNLMKVVLKIYVQTIRNVFANIKNFQNNLALKVHVKQRKYLDWKEPESSEGIQKLFEKCTYLASFEKIFAGKKNSNLAFAFRGIRENNRKYPGFVGDVLKKLDRAIRKIKFRRTFKFFFMIRYSAGLKGIKNLKLTEKRLLPCHVRNAFALGSILRIVGMRVKRKVFDRIIVAGREKIKKLATLIEVIGSKVQMKVKTVFTCMKKATRYSTGLCSVEKALGKQVNSIYSIFFNEISLNYENSLVVQEGIRCLIQIFSTIQIRKKLFSLNSLSAYEKSINPYPVPIKHQKSFKIFFKISKKFKNFQKKCALKKLKRFSITKPSTFHAIQVVFSLQNLTFAKSKLRIKVLRESFLILVKIAGQVLSLQALKSEKITKILSSFRSKLLISLTKSFTKWRIFSKIPATPLKNLKKIILEQSFLKISLAFRAWQYKMDIAPNPSLTNKENYYKNPFCSNIPSRKSLFPLQNLDKNNPNT